MDKVDIRHDQVDSGDNAAKVYRKPALTERGRVIRVTQLDESGPNEEEEDETIMWGD